MKLFFILPLGIIFLSSSCNTNPNDIQEIQETFNSYNTELLNNKGEEAYKFIDVQTISYYDQAIEKIKFIDSISLSKSSIFDKMQVLGARHRSSRDVLIKLDGKSYYEHTINNGQIDKSLLKNSHLENIEVFGDSAIGKFVFNENRSHNFFSFKRERNEWKIDMASLLVKNEDSFKSWIAESGLTENEYISKYLEEMTGKKPSPEIWQPLTEK